MIHFNMTPKDNFIDICNLTTSVLNLRKGSLADKTRKHPLQLARLVAGVIGRKEANIHHKIIGEVLKRHRSLIYHYEKTHNSTYATYPRYRDMYNKVIIAYTDIQNAKKTFDDRYFMKEYLRKKGVTGYEHPQVIIRLKSGKVGVDINTTHLLFSDKLNLIKLALQNYNYEFEIINYEK